MYQGYFDKFKYSAYIDVCPLMSAGYVHVGAAANKTM